MMCHRVLSLIIPKAMVCLIEIDMLIRLLYHGELCNQRRLMIESITSHLSDFRLHL